MTTAAGALSSARMGVGTSWVHSMSVSDVGTHAEVGHEGDRDDPGESARQALRRP